MECHKIFFKVMVLVITFVNFQLKKQCRITTLWHIAKIRSEKYGSTLQLKDIDFPTTNDMPPLRKSLRPETKSVLSRKRRAIDVEELISCTVASVIRVVNITNNNFDANRSTMTLNLKDGGDGPVQCLL